MKRVWVVLFIGVLLATSFVSAITKAIGKKIDKKRRLKLGGKL